MTNTTTAALKNTKRIGPAMAAAVAWVAANPGTAILPVARAVGPHGSTKFGYAAVHRAIRAGLISATRTRGIYSLTAAVSL